MAETIPRILHRIWIGGAIPPVYDHGTEWERLHPDWETHLWTTPPEWIRLLPGAPKGDKTRFMVDVWRLQLLHDHGGIYVDCDVVPLRPFDDLLGSAFVAQSPNKLTVATNAVMGFPSRHPVLAAMLDGLEDRLRTHGGRRVVESVGGFYLTESLDGVDMLPWWMFASRSIAQRKRGLNPGPRPGAYADHLYANTLR